MLHPHLLNTYAPQATHLLFHPQDSGSPGQDFCHHISRNQHRRIDLEGTMLVGDNVIVRIEPDLGSAEDKEAEARIVTVRYAERVLGNNTDAVEFVRCVKLLAGEDARGHDLQVIASHYYGEARKRPVGEVLKEMAMLGMQLAAVTATSDSRLFDEPVESGPDFCTCEEFTTRARDDQDFRCLHARAAARVEAQMTVSDRRAYFMERAAQILSEAGTGVEAVYREEIRSKAAYRHNGHVQGFAHDPSEPFLSFLSDAVERGADEDALWSSFERMSEQYDEGHVVSLHMSDAEKVIVVGTLDDDVDADYLPEDAHHLAAALRGAFVGGKGAQAARKLTADVEYARLALRAERNRNYQFALALADEPRPASSYSSAPLSEAELTDWMDAATSQIYNRRVKRTARAVYVSATGPEANRFGRPSSYALPYTITVNPDADTRSYVVTVLEKLLGQMRGDFHLRGQRTSPLYREFHRTIRTARDTALVAQTIKEAFAAKEEGRISLALFTALNTASKLQRWALESAPLSRVALHLIAEIQSASRQKLMFLRWAMYGTNKPDHAIHTLTRQEKARVWEELKMATGMPAAA
ncbi:MAG: hypothetical protein ACJ74Q_15645 [Pyrinomonadaceae bacterium]